MSTSVSVLLLLHIVAAEDTSSLAPAPPPTHTEAEVAPNVPSDGSDAPAADDLDFDLFDAPMELSPVDLQKQADAETRRRMLELHQGFGIATIGVMAATVALGLLSQHDLYAQSGRRSGDFLWPHRIAAYGSAAMFATTAGLALFAPEPYEADTAGGFDAGTFHRISVSVAAAGMLTQAGLGFYTARKAEAGNREGIEDLTTAHQVLGIVTLGYLTAAALAWLF